MGRGFGSATYGRARQAVRDDVADPLMDETVPTRPEPLRPVEMAIAASQVRAFERALREAHRPWQDALSIACPVHAGADRGRYCWRPPPHAVCQARVSEALSRRARRG